ncbi:MAG: hypothetical protein APF77_04940 [Clostridia bacterium BRH_c25]|nr:MAG: hypothetical protein APF77_04940 [Clostridia bacterium BRH_c25]
MNSKRRLSALIVLFLIAVMLSGCAKNTEVANVEPEITPTPTVEPTPTPEPPKGSPCPLTGVLVEDEGDLKQRPIAVMLDNEYNARPQSGLLEAEIVYEIPVEGNITRYMAIYHHNHTDKIGPVRSARPYFIDKSLEFNAVYVHCGGSPQALQDIVTLKVNALNDLKGSPCFWRSKDRKMPHNLYTSTKLMREVIESNKFNNKTAPEYFKFSEEFLNPDGKSTRAISFNYSKNYTVGYEYDEKDKLYYRTINGVRLKDKESGKEIATTNIIVEKTTAKVLDDVGRLGVNNIGKDRGYYLTAGKLMEIEWSKSSRSAKTIYKDLKGNEILMNKGTTWIQVVPDYVRIDIKE